MSQSRVPSATNQIPGPFNANLIRQVPDDVAEVVGNELSIRVMSYGYHPDDLVSFVSKLQEAGVSTANIRSSIAKQMQLADRFVDECLYQPKVNEYMRISGNTSVNPQLRQMLLNESYDDAKIILQAHEGDVTGAISTRRYVDKLAEWHRLNDFPDGVVNPPGPEILRKISNEAMDYARRLETRIMGSASASGFIVFKQRETKQAPKEGREKAGRDKKDVKIPKINEKKQKIQDIQKQKIRARARWNSSR
jgi:hypothetical protein